MVKPLKISLLGADGSMGQFIARLVLQEKDIQFTHAYTIPTSPNLGKDLGNLLGQTPLGVQIVNGEQFENDCKTSPPDIIIDFTVAKATEKNGMIAAKLGIPIVIGTTGMAASFYDEFKQAIAQSKGIAVVSSNMATGVNIFFKIAQEITRYVSEWDIEIIEAHHHRKKDSPSGTAMTVAQKIAEVLDKNLSDIAKYGRPNGPSLRKIGADEIGIHAIRAGDILGDHTVLYAGPGERIELVHRVHSRECLASGAVRAVKFLVKMPKDGTVFDMQDVLGLK